MNMYYITYHLNLQQGTCSNLLCTTQESSSTVNRLKCNKLLTHCLVLTPIRQICSKTCPIGALNGARTLKQNLVRNHIFSVTLDAQMKVDRISPDW